MEAITGALGIGFETKNKYKIKNSLGQVQFVIFFLLKSSEMSTNIDYRYRTFIFKVC